MVVDASKDRPGAHTHTPPTSTRLFTHTHEDESVDPDPNVVDRDVGQTSHESKPEEFLNEPKSHGWHVSVDESSSYPAEHTHTPSTLTNGKSHAHDDELEDPTPDVDMCEPGQTVHDPRSEDDL